MLIYEPKYNKRPQQYPQKHFKKGRQMLILVDFVEFFGLTNFVWKSNICKVENIVCFYLRKIQL